MKRRNNSYTEEKALSNRTRSLTLMYRAATAAAAVEKAKCVAEKRSCEWTTTERSVVVVRLRNQSDGAPLLRHSASRQCQSLRHYDVLAVVRRVPPRPLIGRIIPPRGASRSAQRRAVWDGHGNDCYGIFFLWRKTVTSYSVIRHACCRRILMACRAHAVGNCLCQR